MGVLNDLFALPLPCYYILRCYTQTVERCVCVCVCVCVQTNLRGTLLESAHHRNENVHLVRL